MKRQQHDQKSTKMMNKLKQYLMYWPMAAALLSTSFAGPSDTDEGVPIRGSLPGVESFEAVFPTLSVQGSGTGNITHLGRVTATWERQASLVDGRQTASYQFTAANGDSLFVESIGQADMEMAPDIHVVENGTITGGTGRFAGATGSLTIERLVVLTGADTDTTSQSLSGTLVLNFRE